MDLKRNCKHCLIALTSENAAKKNAKYFRNECKKCRSKKVQEFYKGNEKRKKYMREYIRRVGKVKQYPCETCSSLCYKKYAKAFCSDKCRFMSYVDKQDECWIWTGCKARRGYGKFKIKGTKSTVASRISYILFKGSIKSAIFICHTCDVPSCVNPDHLWAGTHVENMIDMIDKGRQHSKLEPRDIFKLRNLWESGCSNSKLAERFNITSGTVSNIISRRIWKHV